jgi:hypothetical protein
MFRKNRGEDGEFHWITEIHSKKHIKNWELKNDLSSIIIFKCTPFPSVSGILFWSSASIEIIMWYLSLILFMYSVNVYWFTYVELSLHPWNEVNLIIMGYLLMCCWIWFASIFKTEFSIYFHQGNWSIIFLCVCLCSSFAIRVILVSWNEFFLMLSYFSW